MPAHLFSDSVTFKSTQKNPGMDTGEQLITSFADRLRDQRVITDEARHREKDAAGQACVIKRPECNAEMTAGFQEK